MTIQLIIITLCVLLLFIYLSTQNYDSPKGIMMFSIGFLALFLRKYFPNSNHEMFYVPSTLSISGVLNIFVILLGVITIFIFRDRKIKRNPSFFLMLFICYLPFGFLQQLFFQYVFLETLISLFQAKFIILMIGVLFYSLFHLSKETNMLAILGFMAGLFWMTIYLYYGNIIWPALSHALLAAMYYYFIHPSNRLFKRLKFIKRVIKY